MTDRSNEEPLSSEELLRQARGELNRPSNSTEAENPAAEAPPAEAHRGDPGAAPGPADPGPPSPSSDEPLIPEDFQPAASRRGAPPPPAGFESPGDPYENGQIVTDQPSLGSRLWAKRGWIVGGVFLAILGISFFNRATSVEDLTVGDCFDDPGSEAISQVDIVDCTEPHDYEMFDSVVLAGADGAWPGDFELFEEAYEACLAPFLAYTGVSPDDAVYIWQYDAFAPTEESWAEGSREALCTLFQIDEDFDRVKATSSARAGG